MTRYVQCIKLGHQAEGLTSAPLPTALGQYIYENVSKEAWQGWLRYQTMLINENRLNLTDPKAREYLTQQLTLYFKTKTEA
ncbi:MAG: oxidative damage protection protein [Neisseriales bacterium]|nr:MAG: oxidative damage protection protein [Neisseriales bacterium]